MTFLLPTPPAIVAVAIYRFRDFRLKRKVMPKYRFLMESQWWPKEKLEELQLKKLKKLLQHAYSSVPYYKRKFDEYGVKPSDLKDLSDLKKFPFLTREDIKKNLKELTSRAIPRTHLHLNSTSGSTGENMIFYNDKNSLEFAWASLYRQYTWIGLKFGVKEAHLWAVEQKGGLHDFKDYFKNLMKRKLYLSSYEMTHETMKKYIYQLNRFKPDLIIALPSALWWFSRFIEEQGITLNFIPKAIISSGETLFDIHKKDIERVFKTSVYNRYGSREFTTIAHECSYQEGMHIDSERFIAEIVRGESPVFYGEVGEIVLTDLDNFGMPFIRYRTGDIGVMSNEACKCGRELATLKRVDGRIFDVVVTPSGRAIGGTFWTRISRTVKWIEKFQVIQDSPNSVEFYFVPSREYSRGELQQLLQEIEKYTHGEIKVKFKAVREISPTKSGKNRFVISKYGLDYFRKV